jgi:hypothetical protein
VHLRVPAAMQTSSSCTTLCRCNGALAPLIGAASVVEDVKLWEAQGGGELLAALRPAARTLMTLDTTGMTEDVRTTECSPLAMSAP